MVHLMRMSVPMESGMSYTGSRKDAEHRRMRAMRLLDRGWSQSEVARKLGVSPAAVSQWVRTRREGGAEALRARPHPGARPKLNDRQLQRLDKLLQRAPRAHGGQGRPWTLKRVAEVIERRFGVRYDPSGAWHVLHRMGWSCRTSGERARERDGDAMVQWRKKDRQDTRKRRRKR